MPADASGRRVRAVGLGPVREATPQPMDRGSRRKFEEIWWAEVRAAAAERSDDRDARPGPTRPGRVGRSVSYDTALLPAPAPPLRSAP